MFVGQISTYQRDKARPEIVPYKDLKDCKEI